MQRKPILALYRVDDRMSKHKRGSRGERIKGSDKSMVEMPNNGVLAGQDEKEFKKKVSKDNRITDLGGKIGVFRKKSIKILTTGNSE